jgi:hypothetical protein
VYYGRAMRAGPIAAGIVAFFALTGTPHAVTLVTPDGRAAQPYQRWADAANAPTPDTQIVLEPSGCPDREEPGCTWPGGPIHFDRDAILALSDHPVEVRGEFLHELGHQVDYAMPQRTRERFLHVMGYTWPWRSSANSNHERFAEAYSRCAVGGKAARRLPRGGYDYIPTKRQQRAVCRLLRKARPPS